jgi:hypothetical protein
VRRDTSMSADRKIALTRIDEAQRMAGQLNQDPNSLAADAARTIDDVLGSVAKR